jgi:hypothetical protein
MTDMGRVKCSSKEANFASGWFLQNRHPVITEPGPLTCQKG